MNPSIRKILINEKINLAIRKHRVFKPYDEELSGQPCNQEALSFQTLRSGIIKKHQVFRPFFCHLFRTSPGKSYFFSHLSFHILFIWVGHPLQWDHIHILFIWVGHPLQWDHTSHSFHLGRSPITMRPHFTFFSIWVGRPLQWDRTLYFFHMGKSPITTRPLFTFFPLG
jgi:hypothetical protein